MTDTTVPPPLTEREMRQFVTLAALPTLERALERLRWLEAELAALKPEVNQEIARLRKALQHIAEMRDEPFCADFARDVLDGKVNP